MKTFVLFYKGKRLIHQASFADEPLALMTVAMNNPKSVDRKERDGAVILKVHL